VKNDPLTHVRFLFVPFDNVHNPYYTGKRNHWYCSVAEGTTWDLCVSAGEQGEFFRLECRDPQPYLARAA
jgi:hypothetical protein